MLLAIDVGNTQTVFGLFEGDRLAQQFRVGTVRTHTSDELAVMLRSFVDVGSLDGIAGLPDHVCHAGRDSYKVFVLRDALGVARYL